MAAKDRVDQQQEAPDLAGGKGMSLLYHFFQDQLDPSVAFIDIIIKPGAYAGYHRHQGHESILYVVSGRAENYQDGEWCTLEAGDAVLTKSGHAHALRNIGDDDLHMLEFNGAVGGVEKSGVVLPLPEAIADWA
jgi:quercetin dioxygenase-like cupin family protein